MKDKIQEVLENNLPKQAHRKVWHTKGSFGGDYIGIMFAASDKEINNVRGQHPQCVSLMLDLSDLELTPQVFGCNGGQSIYRKPNMEDSREKYLAMKSVRIPFRRPKPNEKAILAAVQRFVQKWTQELRDSREQLMYQDMVNYDQLLNN